MVKESNLEKGISAIIPTYKGEAFISKLLDSLINQSINPKLFEAIFIVNGEPDSTPDIIKKYQKENPQINIILTYSDSGVCNARNVGIDLSTREYSIFIDDDDYISHSYFEKLYQYAQPNRIVIGTFMDINEDTGEIQESYLSKPLLENSGIVENPYNDKMQRILVITTDKLIPTKYVKNSSFNPDLKNGVDISYYSEFYADNESELEFYIVDKKEDCVYYRLWRANSISRKPISYDFNITDRLKLLNDLNKNLKKAKTPVMKSFIKSLTGGEIVRINNYLEKYPQDYKKVLKDIASYNFEFFPYKYLNENLNDLDNTKRELIISYTFSPTNITTSNSVVKRILTEKKNVDVIYGSLNELTKDYSLEKIVDQFLIHKIEIETEFSSSWENMKNFVTKGMEELNKLPVYEKIYSRANFAHSHFLALEYKLAHPETYWRAEFSDPLIYVFGRDKVSPPIEDEEYVSRINEHLKEKISSKDDINCICEYLTFLFCDEIILTNENQKELMIDINPYDVADIVNEKAIINTHRTLDTKYYYVNESSYKLDENRLNFGYFGAIYNARSFEDFINAFDSLNDDLKDKITLHIFTSTKTFFEQLLSPDLYKITNLNPPVNFLEFLNLTTKFDVLLVEDSDKGNFKLNPYLPSKLSDYQGSDAAIWGICEEGSIMDGLNLDYKSKLNDIDSGKKAIEKIIEDKLNLKNSLNTDIKTEQYYRQRIDQLTQKIYELVNVAQEEFKKDKNYESEIKKLNLKVNELENINSEILNSNSWKATEKLRKIKRKFK
ncbi:glycosyltransferase [uncultured Methanobrevibacter sp.]|uniref:glycosyltransferase n=1 Tax=uncultured Methanobrevibacter sp. TaxID=253161 RepID=UPI002591BDD7|nr:glycosyltransferase [uncultured Methanobrevibacter sp.]